jgi:hypothetical protein
MQTIYAFSYNPVIATGTNTTGTNWRMAYQQPIMLYKGTTNLFRLVVFSVKQKVVDLTNYSVQVQLVDKETQEHFVTKTASITAPTSGVATIEFTEEDLRYLQHRFYHLIARLVNPSDGSTLTSSEILYLDDNYGAFTPITIENAWNFNPTSISTVDGIPEITFTGIGQTPDNLTGEAGNFLRVNSSETALEFSNFLNFDKNIIPSVNETFNLGDIGRRWGMVFANRVNVGNICIYGTQLGCEYSPELDFRVLTQTIKVTDNSTDPAHLVGDGMFVAFNDTSHSHDGPRLEVWYGEQDNENDPPGQHSLDFRAAANSYVELASHDLNSFIGVDDTGPFIQTQWQNDPSRAWRFLGDGELRLPSAGSRITSEDSQLQIVMTFDDIRYLTTAPNGTIYQTIFDSSGKTFFPGDLLPGTANFPIPDPAPVFSLGSIERPWKDLYLSNSTIYLGGVPISVDNAGTLIVNGEPVSGNGDGTGGLPTVTIPGVAPTTYKGLQVAYGMIHTNSNIDEYNVNKIVIHKPTNATVTIDPTSSQDNFRVSGLADSDVLAMFVVYGEVNGPKSLSTLQAFAEAAIDNVILDGGVEGQFNTVDEMKAAFASNYQTLASAANGLYANFDFLSVNTYFNVSAVNQLLGNGFVFTVVSAAEGMTVTPTTAGTGYALGNKILVDYTEYGASDGRYNIVITVSTVDENGGVLTATAEPELPGYVYSYDTWTGLVGYNRVGNGFYVYNLNYNLTNDTIELSSWNSGNSYYVGDRFKILGTDIYDDNNVALASPANDLIITVTSVVGGGGINTYTISGTIPRPVGIWPNNNISDGGADQYDGANYINTNFVQEIAYNSGNTVTDGTAFGNGAVYSFAYQPSMFALFATNNSATYVETSGNSGADSSSITEAGYIYDPGSPEQTFTNAVTHLNVIGTPYAGPEVTFTKTDGGSEVDILIPDDGNGAGVGITRSNNQGIYNPYREGSWNSSVSPGGILWNIDGWADLTTVESRTYAPLYETFAGGLGNKIVGTECVMYLPDNGKYYTVKFTSWTQNSNGGGFAYIRRELNLNSLEEGIRFPDGTRLKSAEGLGRVKLESPGNRRIEEAYGYKAVTVLPVQYTTITATASRAGTNEITFWIDTTATTIDDILNNPFGYGIWESAVSPGVAQFSLDNSTWYDYSGSISGDGNEWGIGVYPNRVDYNQGDTIYFRYRTGGEPAIWWDKNDLPSGGSNFRGAVIDYHSYDGNAGTMVGTIHIVNDSGDENVAHTEVFSGGSNGENIVLWYQDNESQLKFKRVDGQGTTIKIQWSAKVFYGSEFWD